MRHILGAMLVAVVATLVTGGVSEAAHIITVTANHKAGPPQTAQPSGTGSVPVARVYPTYRVVIDFGTFSGGNFNLWNVSPTATATVTPDPNGNFTWAIPAAIQLANPPAGLRVRARLQASKFFGWSDEDTAYTPCP